MDSSGNESRLLVSVIKLGFPCSTEVASSASTSSVTSETPMDVAEDTLTKGSALDAPKRAGWLGTGQDDLKDIERAIRAQLPRVGGKIQVMLDRKKIQKNLSTDITVSVEVIRECQERIAQECDRLSAIANAAQGKPKRDATGLSPEPAKAIRKVGTADGFREVVGRRKKTTLLPTTPRGTPTRNGTGPATKTSKPGDKARQDGGRNKQWARRVKDSGAVLIRPGGGVTYAYALRRLKETVDLESAHVRIQGYRKTKDGVLLVRVRSEAENRKLFQEKLRDSLGTLGEVKDLTSRVKLEILDVDSITTEEDVAQALIQETGDPSDKRVHIIGPNRQDVCLVVSEVEDGLAQTLLRKGRIKIGWMSCRVRERAEATRCYRCLGYGHRQAD